jgi:hypothetical protein
LVASTRRSSSSLPVPAMAISGAVGSTNSAHDDPSRGATNRCALPSAPATTATRCSSVNLTRSVGYGHGTAMTVHRAARLSQCKRLRAGTERAAGPTQAALVGPLPKRIADANALAE